MALDKIPSTGVRLEDIRDAINAFGGSASNSLVTFFQANDMNMWAKYKFTIVANRPFVDSAERWQGGDGKCGLSIPTYNSPSALRTALENGSALWGYNPPQGGEAQPMRLGDARLYTYKAVNPIGSLASSYLLRQNTTGYEFDVNVEVIVQQSELNLTLNDISVNGVKLTDMYFGVYMKPKSGSGYFFGGTSSKVGSQSGLTMTLKGSSGTVGTYMAFPFLSTTPQSGSEQNGTFIGLNKVGQEIEIKSASTQHLITALCIWHADGLAFDYEIVIKNNTSAQQTYSGIKVYLGQRSGDAVVNILSWNAAQTQKAVAAGATATISGTITTTRTPNVEYVCGAGCSTPAISPEFGDMDEFVPEA